MPITSLNLSLCDQCLAGCVFCPKQQTTAKIPTAHMSSAVLEKVIDEVSSDDFPWEVKTIQLGENGDAPLHKHFIYILRYIRSKMPRVFINVATNFLVIHPERSKIIFEEGLLDGIHVNIDGHNEDTYKAQKRLNYNRVIRNIKTFLELRERSVFNVKFSISILTLNSYIKTILKNFGSLPHKLKDIDCNELPLCTYEEVLDSLDWLPDDIAIRESPIFGWAERYLDVAENVKLQCPQLPRVENEAFISPNGDWYPCCMDDKYDQAYGNVMGQSLVEIHNGEKRLEFIERLKAKRFWDIGYPCNKLWSCQVLPEEKK